MKQPRILVIGGMHGNELLGIKLVELLRHKHLKNVDVCIANPRAVKANTRFVESDLNRSFGNLYPDTYESKRAVELAKLSAPYDLVLDFHNTQTPANNCSFVGVGCNTTLFQAIKNLGLSRCVEATYDCINKYCPNVVSVEISVGDALDSPEYWYKMLKSLVADQKPRNSKLVIYRFKDRVTWQQRKNYALTEWEPFKPLSDFDKKCLGVDGIIVPIFIGSKLTEYYATLLTETRTL